MMQPLGIPNFVNVANPNPNFANPYGWPAPHDPQAHAPYAHCQPKVVEEAQRVAANRRAAEDVRKAAEEAARAVVTQKTVEEAQRVAANRRAAEDAGKAAQEAEGVAATQKAVEGAQRAAAIRRAAEDAEKAGEITQEELPRRSWSAEELPGAGRRSSLGVGT